MNTAIKAGTRIIAKRTDANTNCGIKAETTGYICFADLSGVSVYLDSSGYGMEAKMTLEHFAANFEIDFWFTQIASAYVKSQHFQKKLPADFLKKSSW